MARPTASTALVTVAAIFGLFFPSSIGGATSLALNQAAIVLNLILLAAILWRTGALDAAQSSLSLGMVAWMSAVTLAAPTAAFALGVFLIFSGLAVLSSLRLHAVRLRGSWLLAGINVFVLVVGLGLSLDIAVANAFVKTFYNAFHPTLLESMVDWYHKPVLTFATHSTAGFFFYLFFWLNFRTFRATGSWIALGWTIVVLVLGINVRSTTSWVLMAVAGAQLVVYLFGRLPARTRGPLLIAAVPAAIMVAILVGAPARLAALAELIGGTNTAGLRSRYSTTGILAGNLRYLGEAPFSPIGFNYGPEQLFYGDSGVVLALLRGSVPLLVLVYVAFGRFMYCNLRARRDAHCLFLVTCAFEVGYVPLQLFRFTAFLPFVIAYLNGLPPEGHALAPGSTSHHGDASMTSRDA